VVLPPHTAEGVAAESVETFLGNLAIIHDRDASTGDQAWAWIQIGLTVGGGLLAGVAIIQRGGGTIAKSTARALNGEFGLDLKPREWGRALEALKRFEQLPNNHHGRIMSNGDYVDEAGNVIGNLIDYL
jgi:hypothetical protein